MLRSIVTSARCKFHRAGKRFVNGISTQGICPRTSPNLDLACVVIYMRLYSFLIIISVFDFISVFIVGFIVGTTLGLDKSDKAP